MRSCRPLFRSFVRLPVCLVALAALAAAPGFGQLAWERTDPTCGRRAPAELACGAFGDYDFASRRGTAGCDPVASGVAEPLAVDHGVNSDEAVPGPGRGSDENNDAWEVYGIASWIDWGSGYHWKRVHQTMQGAMRWKIFPYGIFFEDATAVSVQALEQASDLHVLDRLCYWSESPNGDRPKIINMSFGRLFDEAPCASGDSIHCEISRLAAHLRSQGVILLAAAGNHGELLFPASDPNVIAVGLLDMEAFRRDGTVLPTANTPHGFQALMPGYGVAVEQHEDLAGSNGGRPLLQPSGSSLASALLTGWLGRWQLDAPGSIEFLLDDRPSLLTLARNGNGQFVLDADGVRYESSQYDFLDRLIEATMGQRPELFDGQPYPDGGYRLAVVASPHQEALPPSRPRLLHDTNLPTPGSEPCFPCRMRRRSAARSSGDADFVIEVAAGQVQAGGRLDAVLLWNGDTYHALEGADLPGFLAAVEAGDDVTLELDVPDGLLDERPIFLVTLFTRTSDDRPYWDVVPIVRHYDTRVPGHLAGFETGDASEWDQVSGGS